jgi:hypothetical protein
VRGEIESYEGRVRQWDDQIAMSTLTLGISTRAPAIAAMPEPGLGQRISSGFHASLSAIEDFGTWLAVTAVALLPWMIILGPGLIFARRAYRRRKQLPAAIARPQASPTSLE